MEQYLQGEEMPAPSVSIDPVLELDRVANSARKELSTSEIDALKEFLEQDEIYSVVISQRLLALHSQNQEPLTEEETAQLKLVARIISHAANTFGPNKVRRWLHEPFLRFGRRAPLELMKDLSGAEEVEEYLVQIDEGYFA